MTSFWIAFQGEQLEQGDYLPGCWIPVIGADFDPASAEPEISVGRSNLVIVTQSRDLANEKIQLAAFARLPIWQPGNSSTRIMRNAAFGREFAKGVGKGCTW